MTHNSHSRRYWYDHRWSTIWLVVLLFILWRANSFTPPQPAPDQLDEGIHEVLRDVDGDTILLTNGARVRLQGINCPESVKPDSPVEPWGPEASQFTKDFLQRAHHRVRLTFSLERKDRYDRFLAFVWDGDTLLNEELVRAGLAHARLDYRYSGAMKRRLAAAQQEAQKAKRGLWSGKHPIPLNPHDEE
ncbi:MAG: thermonuclease family protein [Pirellulales bacterium]